MLDFVKRNTPVFIIGGILAAIFIIFIIISQTKQPSPTEEPNLIKVGEEPQEIGIVGSEKETSSPNGGLSTDERKAVIDDLGLGKGNYSNNVSLLPGDPADKAMEYTKKEFYEKMRLTPEEVEQNYGDAIIIFTENGFEPARPKVKIFQTIVWINQTDKPIVLRQLTNKFSELKDKEILIEANSQLEFKVPDAKVGKWAYEETTTHTYHSIIFEFANKYELNSQQ